MERGGDDEVKGMPVDTAVPKTCSADDDGGGGGVVGAVAADVSLATTVKGAYEAEGEEGGEEEATAPPSVEVWNLKAPMKLVLTFGAESLVQQFEVSSKLRQQ